MQSVVNLSKEVSQMIKLTKMWKIGDEIDSKKRLRMKLTVGVKFGYEVDSKKSLGTKLTVGVKFGDVISTFAKNIKQARDIFNDPRTY